MYVFQIVNNSSRNILAPPCVLDLVKDRRVDGRAPGAAGTPTGAKPKGHDKAHQGRTAKNTIGLLSHHDANGKLQNFFSNSFCPARQYPACRSGRAATLTGMTRRRRCRHDDDDDDATTRRTIHAAAAAGGLLAGPFAPGSTNGPHHPVRLLRPWAYPAVVLLPSGCLRVGVCSVISRITYYHMGDHVKTQRMHPHVPIRREPSLTAARTIPPPSDAGTRRTSCQHLLREVLTQVNSSII